MDLGTIIVGAVVVGLCIVPFYIFKSGTAKRSRELLDQLAQLAQQKGGRITLSDSLGNFAIGLDEQAEVLYFMHDEPGKEASHAIALSKVRHCKPINQNRSMDSVKVVEKLELLIAYNHKHEAETALEFYHADGGNQLSGEYQLLEKWAALINARLKKPAE